MPGDELLDATAASANRRRKKERRRRRALILIAAVAVAGAGAWGIQASRDSTNLPRDASKSLVGTRPACGGPDVLLGDPPALSTTWTALQGEETSVGGPITLQKDEGAIASVESIELVVGKVGASADVQALSAGSPDVLAIGDELTKFTVPLLVDLVPGLSADLPVFAIVSYTTTEACGGATGVEALPVGVVRVR